MSRITSQRAAKAATVASELHHVAELAQGLSLISKNARTLVAGVGDKARGLGVIAQQFSELADQIIMLTQTVGDLAINISKASVVAWRIESIYTQLETAQSMAQEARFIDSIKDCVATISDLREESATELRQLMKRMSVLLDDIRSCIRTSEVISVTFLLEASQTGLQGHALIDMAARIKSISSAINDELTSARTLFEAEDN